MRITRDIPRHASWELLLRRKPRTQNHARGSRGTIGHLLVHKNSRPFQGRNGVIRKCNRIGEARWRTGSPMSGKMLPRVMVAGHHYSMRGVPQITSVTAGEAILKGHGFRRAAHFPK